MEEQEIKYIVVSIRTVDGSVYKFECRSVNVDEHFLTIIPTENIDEDIDVLSFPVRNIIFLATKRIYEE